MTTHYSNNFGKLLFHWKGSVWKAVGKDLIIFLILYYAINLTYRFALNDDQTSVFQSLVIYCEKASAYIPLTFLLGFFVATIVTRWWDQFKSISWPDKFMTLLTTYVKGATHLHIRRTIARWLNLTSVLCWRTLSVRTLKRFPTDDHLLATGLMTDDEMTIYSALDAPKGKWWLPLSWIGNVLKQCQEDQLIDTVLLSHLMDELMAYRSGFGSLVAYSWVNLPLVYTQVVTLATYGYFAICLVSRQIVGPPDIYVPIFTILQFLFYVGWLKVGQDLMNPFGEDDDDFELNYILDRNIQVAHIIAEDGYGQMPNYKTVTLSNGYPGTNLTSATATTLTVPRTKASSKKRDITFKGHHLSDAKINQDNIVLVYPECSDCCSEYKNGSARKSSSSYVVKSPSPLHCQSIPMIDSSLNDAETNVSL